MLHDQAGQDKFAFPVGAVALAVELIKEMSSHYLGLNLTFRTEPPVPDKLRPEDLGDYLETEAKMAGGVKRVVRVQGESSEIVESECEGGVVRRHDLAVVQYIVVQLKSAGVNVVSLHSGRGIMAKYRLQTHKMDFLLAHILHLCSLKEGGELRPPLLLLPIDLKQSVLYLGKEGDSAFESSWMAVLEETRAGKSIYELRLHELLANAAFNASFKSSGYNPKLAATLFSLLAEYAQLLSTTEANAEALKDYDEQLKHPPYSLKLEPALGNPPFLL